MVSDLPGYPFAFCGLLCISAGINHTMLLNASAEGVWAWSLCQHRHLLVFMEEAMDAVLQELEDSTIYNTCAQ